MTLEKRSTPVEIGETGQDENGRSYMWARVLNYDIVDSHNTSWRKGVFADSLTRSMPKLVIGHDWDGVRVIGKAVESRESDEGLDLKFRFSDFEANPEARRFYAHARDGEVDEFSVGFFREADEDDPNHRSTKRITRAGLKEVSFVLSGSVPGTKLLALRSHKDTGYTPEQLSEAVEASSLDVSTMDADMLLPLASVALARSMMATDDYQRSSYATTADMALDEAMVRAGIELPEVPINSALLSTQSTATAGVAEEQGTGNTDTESRAQDLLKLLDARSRVRTPKGK